ncbi:arylsulfatase-like [Amphiura filiformis]|uniref:arylsulfatase-like n=1 Tax=Amphiura filiformis TaxID=82378 RepID=UPI003B21D290
MIAAQIQTAALATLMLAFVLVNANQGNEAPSWGKPPRWPPGGPHRKPNIIIFNADDMGWGDFSSYGHPTQEWGPVDDMAYEGMRFTNFYSASSLCSPSRAALMTGRLPIRIGVWGDGRVFWPNSVEGLPRYEVTIAEALKEVGYVTGLVGKWHLGVNAYSPSDGEHMPHHHGFDYVGTNLPLSNAWQCDEEHWHMKNGPFPLFCYLYKNATILQQPYSHYKMSEAFVNDATGFMRDAQQQRKPFFLYYGTAQTHADMFSSNEGFRGSSKRGRYGDNVREMAWTVGAIMDEVKRMEEDFNTLAIFTNDNGPLVQICNEGGDAGILKGGKMNYWEGGVRVPGIFRWPGHIKAGITTDVVASQMDIFPTLMTIVGGSVPDDRIIDGQDISSTLFKWLPEPQPEPTSKLLNRNHPGNEPRMLVWYCPDTTDPITVRYGSHKFHFVTQTVWTKEANFNEPGRCGDGGFPLQQNVQCSWCSLDQPEECVTQHDPPLMFNLDQDPNEAYPLDVSLPHHKAVLDEMMPKLQAFQASLIIPPPLMTPRDDAVWPCCDGSFPDCGCNYQYLGPVPPPGDASPSSKEFLDMMIDPENDNYIL